MNERDAIEQAYKNGFEAGVKEFAERLKHTIHQSVYQYWNTPDGGYYLAEDVDDDIDTLVEEMTVNYESSKQRKEDDGK